MIRHEGNDFLYSKEDYINTAKALPFTMIEILFIFPWDKVFDNTFWDHFEYCIPFEQDVTLKCFTTKRINKVNFNHLSEIVTHVKSLDIAIIESSQNI